jgi:hypothetical protein
MVFLGQDIREKKPFTCIAFRKEAKTVMKESRLPLFMVVFAGLIFLAFGVLTAADVADVIVIDNEGYKRNMKGPVKLSHEKHATEYGTACTDCHHVYEDGKNVWKEGQPVQKCIECHDPQKTEGNVKRLMTAYHDNCKDCHKEHPDTNAPYKKCNDCHEKKE